MRNTEETLGWYRDIGSKRPPFDPDGMCLKICRTARGIPMHFPTAIASQHATPGKYRINKVSDIRRGMVGYFDDPRDENPAGHIVTWAGLVKGGDPSKLRDRLCWTNSVVSGRLVIVRGDFFERVWGDAYQFSAVWLNGMAFPDFVKESPQPVLKDKPTRLLKALDSIDDAIQFHTKQGNGRLAAALKRDYLALELTIDRFS